MTSYQIDKQLEPILRQMEKTGVLIDVDFLAKLDNRATLELAEIQENIFALTGKKFNLNSPSQLANILYQELKIQPSKSGIKKKKTHHSTSASDLKKIESLHPSIKYILKYRELSKLKNTYLDKLPEMVDEDNKLHTTYKIETATGRLSSSNPNLQNLPAVNEDSLGGKIRRAFKPSLGRKLLIADYSQIELRIAAHLSGDESMIKIFNNNKDIHTKTAEELGVSRRTAKVINFGILYGMSAYGVSETLGINVEDAQGLIDKYFLTYPQLAKYSQKIVAEAQEKGYVETLYGRRRELSELFSPIERIRNFAQRAAINTPIQGTAADIIKLAMVAINKKLSVKNKESIDKLKAGGCKLQANLILQVHDELVFDVAEDQFNDVALMVKDGMENVVKLKVPLIVNLYKGNNWGELEKFA